MARIELPGLLIYVNGAPARSETLLGLAGAYQLTLSTVVIDRDMELHSSYLGSRDGPQAAASHLLLQPGEEPVLVSVSHGACELPVQDDRRRCLFDHLWFLKDSLSEATGTCVEIDVDEPALELVDVAGLNSRDHPRR